MTDEQQWNRLKNEFHYAATQFLNYMQTLSAADLCNKEVIKALVDSRHHVVEAYLHIFRFVEDANFENFRNILKGDTGCGDKQSQHMDS